MNRAFTVVELLLVIVVIGILAAVVLVAYNGISREAIHATMQGDLDTTTKLAEAYNIENGEYPTYLEEIKSNTSSFRASGGNKITYVKSDDGYCVEVSNPQTDRIIRSAGYADSETCLSNVRIPEPVAVSSGYIEGATCGRRNFVASNDLSVLLARCSSGPYWYSYSLDGGASWVKASSIASYSSGQIFALSGDGMRAYSGFHANSSGSDKYCVYSSTRASASASFGFGSMYNSCNGAQTLAIDDSGDTLLKSGARVGQHAQVKTPDSPSLITVNALGGVNNGGSLTGAAVSGDGSVCALVSTNSGNVGISTSNCKTWSGSSSKLCGVSSTDLYFSYDGSKLVLFGRTESSTNELVLYLREQKACIPINPKGAPASLTHFAMSDDGRKMAAVSEYQLFTSTNGGVTWVRGAEGCTKVSSPVIAADGSKIGIVCTRGSVTTYDLTSW